ncbi:hypothetical protein CBF35_06550 [Vagococcus salmoninarum]|uniref:Histidine phosphatase family protein n=1 Tax=Vagococcus salmoninarum TaxID=2739 RepID=A0A429ZQQ2_9ENTE|nr:histidine phosphatase family protein [Vagococcus salmoninarum]RST96054.1 hypothetical protein CBF35_06550 [Vagococcus salmoninarum]
MTTTLYFVRHGETLWNAEKRMQGHLNSNLTAAGINQATLLGKAFKDETIAKCFTSDSPRALATAELVTAYLPVTPEVSPALREIGMGSWEGRTRQDIKKMTPSSGNVFGKNLIYSSGTTVEKPLKS